MGIGREELIQEVIRLLGQYSKTDESAIAIAIDGEWGVGKSHMYRTSLKQGIKQNLGIEPIYTSVFGKKDENEIIQDLIAQFLTIENQRADSIKNIINGALKLFGKNVDTDFLFRMFRKEHMKNTIICIDDFERLSDKIPIQDVLGLISELKENKGCHIILLCNQMKINEKHQEQFNAYREKIIDKTLTYRPSSFEQFELVKDLLVYEIYSENFPIDDVHNLLGNLNAKYAINLLETTNLREIKKRISCFNEYCNGLESEYLNDEYTKILFCNAMFYCLINNIVAKDLKQKLDEERNKANKKINNEANMQNIEILKMNLANCGFGESKYIINWHTVSKDMFVSSAKIFDEYQKNNLFTFRRDEGYKSYIQDEQLLLSRLSELAIQYQFQKEFKSILEANEQNPTASSQKFYEKHKDNPKSLWFMLNYRPENFNPSFFKNPAPFEYSIFENIGTNKIKEMIIKIFDQTKSKDNTWLREKQEHEWISFFKQKGIEIEDKLFPATPSS